MEESWKDIAGYEGEYQASSLGRIRSLKSNKTLQTHRKELRYDIVHFCKKGIAKTRYVHSVIAETFLNVPTCCPTCGTKFEVNHKNGDVYDNAVVNLEYVSRQQNMGHSLEKRRRNNKHRKLSHEQVVQIKSDLTDGVSLTQTGRKFGVATSTISEIAHGRTWKI